MKKNTILLSVFLLAASLSLMLILTNKSKNEKIDLILKSHLSKLKTHYEVLSYNQKVLADNIYNDTVNRDDVIDILEKAFWEKDEKRLKLLREKLKNALQEKYSKIVKFGILQYHFIFPDNKVFLRMHKPGRFGDSLEGIRPDFEYVNKHKKEIRGFSHGRTAHGFRNVYPLYGKNGKHIGAMEVSFSSESFEDYLSGVSKIDSHFLIDKKVFESKAWQRDDLVLTYVPSKEHPAFMCNVTKTRTEKLPLDNEEAFSKLKTKIQKGITKDKMFSVYVDDARAIKVVSFYPVKQNVLKNTVAWIVAYEKEPVISKIVFSTLVMQIIIALLLVTIFYFLYKNMRAKEMLLNKAVKKSAGLQQRLKEAQHIAKIGSWIYNADKKELHWSTEAYEIYGIDRKITPVTFDMLCEYTHSNDVKKLRELRVGSLKEKSSYFLTYPVTLKNGKVKYITETGETVFDKDTGATILRGTIQDVTQIKTLQDKDLEQQKMIAHQSKMAALGEMTSNIAHQWRQPLSVISTAVTGLQVKKDMGAVISDEELNEIFEHINQNTEFLSKTIDDFTNYINMKPVKHGFDSANTIESFLSVIDSSLKDLNINVVSYINENEKIKGYPNELIQCFINIFNNSRDALINVDEKERYFFIYQTVDDKDITFVFKDNGGGIPKETLPKIFEPYFTTKHQSKGTGLGLHMTYNLIVNGMNGSVDVDNVNFTYNEKDYKGARVVIKIPIDFGEK